jgi:hypothetical protein
VKIPNPNPDLIERSGYPDPFSPTMLSGAVKGKKCIFPIWVIVSGIYYDFESPYIG